MNQPAQPRARSNQRRRGQAKRSASAEIWADSPPLPELAPIARPDQVSALIRSLGEAPMNVRSTADKYFITVIERAAAAAVGLAFSADLLAGEDD